MVLIEMRDEFKSATWVDGYLPDEKTIKSLYRAIARHYLADYAVESRLVRERDELFSELLGFLGESIRRSESAGIVDLFYLGLAHELLPVSSGFSPLYKEVVRENRNYRVLIGVYDTQSCPKGKTYMQKLANRSRLGIKPRGQYHDFRAFKEAATAVMEAVLEPYDAPCGFAKKSLEFLGFKVCGINL